MPLSRIPSLAAIALVLGGCHGGGHRAAGAVVPGTPRPASATGPSVAAQTVGMVEAPAVSRSDAGVALKFAPETRPTVGVPLTVDLALVPMRAADSASLELAASPDFALGAKVRDWTLSALAANQVYRHRITLTPSAAGVLLLNLSVSMHRNANIQTSEFSLPLIVSAGPAATAAAAH